MSAPSKPQTNTQTPSPAITHASISSILLASFLILPRSSQLLLKTPPLAQRSSLDRPEHALLTPLTANPLATLLWTVGGTLVAMLIWGHTIQQANAGSSSGSSVDPARPSWTRARDALVTIMPISVIVAFVLFALGAPLDSFFPHTFLLASQLSLLTVFPILQGYGIPPLGNPGITARYRLKRLLSEFNAQSPLERTIVYSLAGTLIGAWTGAGTFALDWDRPWQSYPLPATFGSILGFTIGGMLSYL